MTSRTIITLPWSLVRQFQFDWDIDWREQVLPDAVGGVTQTVYSQFPRWVGAPRLVLGPADLRAWRAARWHGGGMNAIYRLPMKDPAGTHIAELSGYSAAGLPFSTGERFSTGQGFEFRPFVTTTATAAAGATSILVDDSAHSGYPKAGAIVDFDYWAYGITSRVTEGAAVRLTVAPALRTAIPSGSVINLAPYIYCEAAEAGTGRVGYDLTRVSRPTVSLREWINRT